MRRQTSAITARFENLGKQSGECYRGVDTALSRLESGDCSVRRLRGWSRQWLYELSELPARLRWETPKRFVTVAVIQDSRDPFGARIDGLLGMSFLARFSTRIGPKGIELTAVQSLDAAASPLPDMTAAPSVKARAP